MLKSSPTNFQDYLTIKEAAAFLGVSAATLRNWDRAGKVKASRHPVNGYRLYVRKDLETLLGRVTHKAEAGNVRSSGALARVSDSAAAL